MAAPIPKSLMTATDGKILLSNLFGALLHRCVSLQNSTLSGAAALGDVANRLWKQSLLTQLPVAERSPFLQRSVSPYAYVAGLVVANGSRLMDSAEGGALTTFAKGASQLSPVASAAVVGLNSLQQLKTAAGAFKERPLSSLGAMGVHLFNLGYEALTAATSFGLGSDEWLKRQRGLQELPRAWNCLREPVQTIQAAEQLTAILSEVNSYKEALASEKLTLFNLAKVAKQIQPTLQRASDLDRAIVDLPSHSAFETSSKDLSDALALAVRRLEKEYDSVLKKAFALMKEKQAAVNNRADYVAFQAEEQAVWNTGCKEMQELLVQLKNNAAVYSSARLDLDRFSSSGFSNCQAAQENVGDDLRFRNYTVDRSFEFLLLADKKIPSFQKFSDRGAATAAYITGRDEINTFSENHTYKKLEEELLAKGVDTSWVSKKIESLMDRWNRARDKALSLFEFEWNRHLNSI